MAFVSTTPLVRNSKSIHLNVSAFRTSVPKVLVPPVRNAKLQMTLNKDETKTEKSKDDIETAKTPPPQLNFPYEAVFYLYVYLDEAGKKFRIKYWPYGYGYSYDGYVTSYDQFTYQVRNNLTKFPFRASALSSPGGPPPRPIDSEYSLRRAVQHLQHNSELRIKVKRKYYAVPGLKRFPIETNKDIIRTMMYQMKIWQWGSDVPYDELSYGDQGDDVRHLQYLLTRLGMMELSDTDQVSGSYQTLTANGVFKFQSRCGLEETGRYDWSTAKYLQNVVDYYRFDPSHHSPHEFL